MLPNRRLGFLRGTALLSVLVGAVGSLGLMLYAGRHQNSLILIVLFTLWELSPFVALVWAHVVSKHWLILNQVLLSGVMLVLSLGSLTLYGYVSLGPPRPRPAFVFLVVPLGSWLLIAIVLSLSALLSGRRSRRSGSSNS